MLVVVTGTGGSQAWGQDDRSELVIHDERLSESSALALAPFDDDLLYTVNDSGHDPLVYVVGRTSAEVVGTTALDGLDTDTADLEAVAVDGEGTLWVGDTGDNLHHRSDTALYALPAPGSGERRLTPRPYPLEYASGRPDVEAMLIDPVSGDGWLVTKGLLGGQLLALPDTLSPGDPVTPEPVSGVPVPGLVTDATFLPPGHDRSRAAVLRTYGSAYVYRLPDWTPAGTFRLPRQQQGESLAALPGGRTLLAGSEGTPALVDAVAVPGPVLDRLAGPPTLHGGAGVGSGTGDDAVPPRLVAWVVAGAGAGGLLVLAVLRRRTGSRSSPGRPDRR